MPRPNDSNAKFVVRAKNASGSQSGHPAGNDEAAASNHAAERNGQPYLVFTRYGTDSFLTKIVISPNESYEMPLTGQQKEILAKATSTEQVNVPAGGSR